MDKIIKSSNQTESYHKIPRTRPKRHPWSKHRLINVDATPVLKPSAFE